MSLIARSHLASKSPNRDFLNILTFRLYISELSGVANMDIPSFALKKNSHHAKLTDPVVRWSNQASEVGSGEEYLASATAKACHPEATPHN